MYELFATHVPLRKVKLFYVIRAKYIPRMMLGNIVFTRTKHLLVMQKWCKKIFLLTVLNAAFPTKEV